MPCLFSVGTQGPFAMLIYQHCANRPSDPTFTTAMMNMKQTSSGTLLRRGFIVVDIVSIIKKSRVQHMACRAYV